MLLILLVFTVGIISVAVPLQVYYSQAKKRVEPEIAIRPENGFERTLRVVGDVDYKPFTYFHNDESEPHGYDVELISELANRMKCNLDLQLMEWNDAVARMQERKADLILGCDWQDASVMDCSFTIPTFEEKFVAFEITPSNSFSDLYGKKIAVIEGCGLKETLMRYQLWSNCREYDTVTACVQAVLDGECDCFIAHHTIGEVSIRTFGQNGQRFRGRMDIASGQMCFGVTPDNPELFESVNEVLLAMRADGTMDSLAHKWLERFDADVTPAEYLRKHPLFLSLIVDLLLAVMIVFLIMNHFLIRKEKDRAIAAEQSREENSDRFLLTLRSIGDGIITTDAKGIVTMLNPNAETLLGCKQSDVLGKPHTDVFRIVHDQTGKPVTSPLTEALQSGDVAAGADMTDLISASGQRYHIASNAAPIRARSGDSPFSARLIYHYSRCAGKSKIRGKIKV